MTAPPTGGSGGAPAASVERDVAVIVVAAGSGTRTGSSELKQFRWIAGKPMLLHSVQSFMARRDVASVICVLPRSHAADPPPWLFQCDVERLVVTVGGRTRFDSVVQGIMELPEEARVVLVHDAARPLLSDAVLDRVVATARTGVGAVAALPVVDTLKEVDDDGRIVRTVERARLWRAQTPQGFPREMLEGAYHAAWSARAETPVTATDDAAVCEGAGHTVVVVRGSERLMKVTEPHDFDRADAIARLAD